MLFGGFCAHPHWKIFTNGEDGIGFRIHITNPMHDRKDKGPFCNAGAGRRIFPALRRAYRRACPGLALAAWLLTQFPLNPPAIGQQLLPDAQTQPQHESQFRQIPPRVTDAQRFLLQRGLAPGHRVTPRVTALPRSASQFSGIAADPAAQAQPALRTVPSATWQPLGPTAVESPDFGLVTGRVAALALDPSDATGNRLYIGTTGGGPPLMAH
ncbi:hypothetical protein SBA5_30167 [Candidatus Sulfotelmatomonas gaucii]|uniref:Uncharacterized protein n=1 Tax=Candidatus Sulfuritelmatomonas gaucii TaxID=2043161 RepID=A0A2N9LCF1_9BACT|nr:hypothetical protein SBA5_30167 [Candidatus Sulfotelmatomonas gaucii]